MIYLTIFTISFLAATILPISSELTLAGLIKTSNYNDLALVSFASLGNVLGSAFNWLLGFYLQNYTNEKWFPFKQSQINKASSWFQKIGIWSLLFAWVPVIGDPLTLVAGILRIRFSIFLFFVSLGKISRYFFLYYLIN